MNGEALIYRPGAAEPERIVLVKQPSLSFWQKLVGGYIEVVPEFETVEIDGAVRPCVVFCNEEGKLEQLPVNNAATLLWDAAMRRRRDRKTGAPLYPTGLFAADKSGRLGDFLVGPIVVVIGDAEFIAGL